MALDCSLDAFVFKVACVVYKFPQRTAVLLQHGVSKCRQRGSKHTHYPFTTCFCVPSFCRGRTHGLLLVMVMLIVFYTDLCCAASSIFLFNLQGLALEDIVGVWTTRYTCLLGITHQCCFLYSRCRPSSAVLGGGYHYPTSRPHSAHEKSIRRQPGYMQASFKATPDGPVLSGGRSCSPCVR